MTDRPAEEVRRPATARPRRAEVDVAAEDIPSDNELFAIERGLVDLPRHSGAAIREDVDLGVVLALLHGRGPGYNFAGCPRWPASDAPLRLEQLANVMRQEREWPALVVADTVSQPDELPAVLADAGWVEIERERILWVKDPPGVPHLDPALRIEAVTPRSVGIYERVERDIFGLAEDFAAQRTAGLSYSISAGWSRAYL